MILQASTRHYDSWENLLQIILLRRMKRKSETLIMFYRFSFERKPPSKWLIQALGKIAETLQILYTFFFINMVLDHLWLSIQLQSFLEWTHTSIKQSLAEFDTVLLEEHIQITSEMLEVVICSALQSPKLTRVVQWYSDLVIVLAREDDEVHLHALQTIPGKNIIFLDIIHSPVYI
jgi:hypothetical protein